MIAVPALFTMVLSIYILAVVTDRFFIPSLDRISDRWRLPPNVAGASLMAMGSSAPELAIALIALFKEGGAHSDVGIGTIVGSAVFNILVITGVSAIFKEARIALPAIIRDTVFYMTSIILLLFVFWDGRVFLKEAVIFVVWYILYLIFLFLMPTVDPEMEAEAPRPKPESGPSFFRRATRAVGKGIGLLAGDVERSHGRAFIVSILLIAGLSWVLVDSAVAFAESVGIPPVIVALTLLAAGTSAPDLISSVLVARQGRGSMAVANAIGSNIFDILVGLGIPWLVALLCLGRPAIVVGTDSLILSTVILMGTVIILFAFLYTDRLLTRKEGWALVGLYAAYVVWTVAAG